MLQRAWHLPLASSCSRCRSPPRIVALRGEAAHRPGLDRVLPARCAAVAHRPGALLDGGDQPARAAAGAPLAQPGVGDERRPGAARGARVHRSRSSAEDDFVWWEFVLQDVSVGLADGPAGGVPGLAADAARRGWPRSPAPEGAVRAGRGASPPTGSPTLPPEGNGFIAVFVCAIALGIRRPDIRACFEARSRTSSRSSSSACSWCSARCSPSTSCSRDGLAAVAIVVFTLLVARPVAVFAALAGTARSTRRRRRSWPGSGRRAWRR